MNISVVVVEYHSLDEIRCCIKAFKESVPGIEVIVSSNSQYNEEEQRRLVEEIPGCKWCFNEKNGGFAYAMNEGLKVAVGDYLIIANPDCVVKYGIENMAEFLSAHPEVGAIAPKIIDESGNLQDSCREYITLQRFIVRQIQRILKKEEVVLDINFNYNTIQTVDWVIGAFIMVPRQIYEITNGLSLDYFMYAEDMDWCTRIRRSGYEVVYFPEAEITYKGSRKARQSIKYASIFMKSLMSYWNKYGFFSINPPRRHQLF